MATLEELRAAVREIEDEQRKLNDEIGDQVPTEDQDKTWDELVERHKAAKDELAIVEKRAGERRSVVAGLATRRTESGDAPRSAPNVNVKADPYDVLRNGGHGVTRQQFVDANLRVAEGLLTEAEHQKTFERNLKRHAGDRAWATQILARSHPDYTSAFSKLVTGNGHMLTDDEKRAAMTVGTNTAGGFLVPSFLDPTLILTNSGVSNVIRGISRQVTLTEGNTWKGITTAGATASWDAEVTEVSDDTPAIAQPSIPIYKAQALIQASIESFEDIPNLTSDVLMILADARDRLEAAAHATGSGSAQPTGIFTALDANTNVEIISTTANVIGLVDLQSVYRQLPVRWRGRSTWLMNPAFALEIQALGTAVSASYTRDLTEAPSPRLIGRPVVESDEAPSTDTTTVNDNAIVLGDFQNFVIVDKPGSAAVEFIPHLFNTSNNLPDGRRAWYMHWRNGSDSVNDLAFRLLQEKTSA